MMTSYRGVVSTKILLIITLTIFFLAIYTFGFYLGLVKFLSIAKNDQSFNEQIHKKEEHHPRLINVNKQQNVAANDELNDPSSSKDVDVNSEAQLEEKFFR